MLLYEGTYKGGNWDNGVLKNASQQWKVIDGIPLFNSDEAGDQFDNTDIEAWAKDGIFKRNWENKNPRWREKNSVLTSLCTQAANLELPIMDIASGPGLGLIPDILAINPQINCLATDACSAVVINWKEFFKSNNITANISFAAFDATRMPIKSNSIDVITSHIGLSSIRYSGIDRMDGVLEAARILKSDGYIFAIENQWTDKKALKEAFNRWGRQCWLDDNEMTWTEKFEKAKLKIVDAKLQNTRLLTPEDNELGQAAHEFGIELGLEFTAYLLRKM